MKIGDKEYKPNITNRVIFDIEEHFNSEIMQLMNNAVNLKTKDMAHLIHFSVRDDFDSFDDFVDKIELTQYVACATEVGSAMIKAFGLDKAAKKK